MEGLRITEVPCQEWNSHHVQFWMAPISQKVSHSGDVMAGPRRNIFMISSWNLQQSPCLIVQVPHFLAPEREDRPPFSLQRPLNFLHRKLVWKYSVPSREIPTPVKRSIEKWKEALVKTTVLLIMHFFKSVCSSTTSSLRHQYPVNIVCINVSLVPLRSVFSKRRIRHQNTTFLLVL